MGAGGCLESAGTEVYEGSLRLRKPGEFWMVMLELFDTISAHSRMDDRCEGDDVHGQVVVGGLSSSLASDETAPGFVALVDDLSSVLLVLGLSRESERVLGLSVGNLVYPTHASQLEYTELLGRRVVLT